MRAIVLRPNTADPAYANAPLEEVPKPELVGDRDVLVRLGAAALNHRDVWIRHGAYPTPGHGSILAADGAGIVEDVKHAEDEGLIGNQVLINCSINWDSAPEGPEIPEKYGLLGYAPLPGTLAEYIAIDRKYIHAIPEHLSVLEGAAIPLASLTAWRALFSRGEAKAGDRVLITGIGGGVALFALQFAVAAGIEVYVTSSSDAKIAKAVELGAKGGVNYREATWPVALKELLKKNRPDSKPEIDTIVDGAASGVDAMISTLRLGGRVVNYGVTSSRTDPSSAKAPSYAQIFFRQADWRGTTMGSAREFRDCLAFIEKHKLKPIIADVFQGLENAEKAFEKMKNGSQFGKLVVQIAPSQ
ncbi:NAD(P)-binding protein [Gonapodya prolifera JEL478]|uniref:NAD(P)-binding protein n=1 Tax=Gonapodya prolifera (strain JEL478) TaxID=1344416 RepID=A0A138ZYK2_GONPJ|nr:NAD(P)-binding protein [Gonapodya prolifera JEL478]|eukprot:KXS09579.1 NAD(P)-binding protein [Gonapodya prolifera JEL478]